MHLVYHLLRNGAEVIKQLSSNWVHRLKITVLFFHYFQSKFKSLFAKCSMDNMNKGVLKRFSSFVFQKLYLCNLKTCHFSAWKQQIEIAYRRVLKKFIPKVVPKVCSIVSSTLNMPLDWYSNTRFFNSWTYKRINFSSAYCGNIINGNTLSWSLRSSACFIPKGKILES